MGQMVGNSGSLFPLAPSIRVWDVLGLERTDLFHWGGENPVLCPQGLLQTLSLGLNSRPNLRGLGMPFPFASFHTVTVFNFMRSIVK